VSIERFKRGESDHHGIQSDIYFRGIAQLPANLRVFREEVVAIKWISVIYAHPEQTEMSLLYLEWDGKSERERESERATAIERKRMGASSRQDRPIQGTAVVVIYVRLEPIFLAIIGSAPVCLSQPFSSHLAESADQNLCWLSENNKEYTRWHKNVISCLISGERQPPHGTSSLFINLARHHLQNFGDCTQPLDIGGLWKSCTACMHKA
jgi:hypothetical protein